MCLQNAHCPIKLHILPLGIWKIWDGYHRIFANICAWMKKVHPYVIVNFTAWIKIKVLEKVKEHEVRNFLLKHVIWVFGNLLEGRDNVFFFLHIICFVC